jgi:hypothetical protein
MIIVRVVGPRYAKATSQKFFEETGRARVVVCEWALFFPARVCAPFHFFTSLPPFI